MLEAREPESLAMGIDEMRDLFCIFTLAFPSPSISSSLP